ncbi:unnamed protein product [Schistosoma curassoni]|uniref:DDHD domain-containing protein n=1 Tax=Schistosoma curassoni TaxID=6186 RepID=A0A183K8B3_9TREM|nr:unnamed protein product [Schistosoma curassoni]
MKASTSEGKHGIQWAARMQLDDLDFADDLALLSQSQQQMQEKMITVAAASAALDLNTHRGKSKILRYNIACTNAVTIDGEDLEDVETFTYLAASLMNTVDLIQILIVNSIIGGFVIELANLFLIGSPLALFISVNDLCPPTYINPSTNSLQLTNSTDDERDPTSNSHSVQNSITSTTTTTSTSKHTGVDLDEIDPEALFSYFACRRVFNIFHSYDPVAYRLEPLLLKHYANISPVVIPKASINHLEKCLSIKDISLINNNKSNQSDSQTPTLKGSNTSLTAIDDIESTHSMHTLDLSDSDSDSSDLSLNGASSSHGSDHKEQKRKTSTSAGKHRKQWTARMQLDGLDFADDLALLSHTQQQMRKKTTSVAAASEAFFKRLSVVDENSVYKQHQSLAMKIFSNYITRRSSNVTNLNPILCQMRSMPTMNEKQLRRRVDYEWQKSFSPLAILGAHNSYWSSHELAFFMLYQIFGPPHTLR